MAERFKVEGGAQLRTLTLKLKEADKKLLNKMRRELRRAAAPAVAAVEASERAELPKAGGLNEWVASTPVVVRITNGKSASTVRIVQSKRGEHGKHDLERMNKGRLRHPVFGHRKVWVQQEIASGWWDRPLNALAPEVAAAMRKVMEETARTAGFRL